MRLPGYIEVELKALGIHIERYGRAAKGTKNVAHMEWYFCGFYWHRGTKTRLHEGPFGPYPCRSAAAAAARLHSKHHQWQPDRRMLNSEDRRILDRIAA